MHIELIFLGTSAAVPSAKRNHASILLRYFDEIMLFDCGEGTQRQLIKAKKSMMKIKKIFITHYHGDHFLGLPGLIQSMSFNERKEKLKIYAPEQCEAFLENLLNFIGYNPGFEIEIECIKNKKIIEEEKYKISFFEVEHNILTYGIAFQEKKGRVFLREKAIELGLKPGPDFAKLKRGESVEINGRVITPDMVLGEEKKSIKIVYSSDTRPCESTIKHAENAYLIHDSTFSEDKKDRAIETMHSTAKEAAEVAKAGKAKKLFLFHISPRYENAEILLKESREIFNNVELSKDLLNTGKLE